MEDLFESFFEESLMRDPLLATRIGDLRYNDRLPNFLGPEHREEQERFERGWLERVREVDRETLSARDRLSYDVFVYEREIALAALRFPSHLLPVNQFFSVPSRFAELGSGQSVQPFATEKDYRNFLGRISDMVIILDQAIENMRHGLSIGLVQPALLVEKTLPQLAAQVVEDPRQSMFFVPLSSLPEELDETVKAELTSAYEDAIRTQIVPAYARLYDFLKEDYLPGCRDTVAHSALPDGEAWYGHLVNLYTNTDMTADEIHDFGLEEVARLREEMRQVAKRVGFDGGLAGFFEHLRTDDRFYCDSEEEILQGYRALRERVDAALPAAFDVFPGADYEVRKVPDFTAASSAGAFYRRGTPDGSRPGVFYVNTHNLRSQPRFGMMTLSIHEATPGHHFQISIAQEVDNLPRFRRFGGTTAYAEGWALYAESLGRELGLFAEPYDDYGRLEAEMLRAIRLVVDTGLHSRGWSRERAIAYMTDNSSMPESDVVAEIERYIALPGQALSYKIGQRVISGLRAEAEAALGERFDLRAFHRQVLLDGSLPLPVLSRKIRDWLRTGAL